MGRSKSKYRNIKTVVDNIQFDSKREAARYSELILLRRANEISDLKLHPRFELCCGTAAIKIRDKHGTGRRIFYYADFSYWDYRVGELVVEDVKGFDTQVSRLKRAILECNDGIRVQIVR